MPTLDTKLQHSKQRKLLPPFIWEHVCFLRKIIFLSNHLNDVFENESRLLSLAWLNRFHLQRSLYTVGGIPSIEPVDPLISVFHSFWENIYRIDGCYLQLNEWKFAYFLNKLALPFDKMHSLCFDCAFVWVGKIVFILCRNMLTLSSLFSFEYSNLFGELHGKRGKLITMFPKILTFHCARLLLCELWEKPLNKWFQ